MLVSVLKWSFALVGLIFAGMIIAHKLWVRKLSDNMLKSDYVACIAGALFFYLILDLFLIFLIPSLKFKCIMGLFGISPFVLGRLATFHTEKFYSIIQLLIIFISIGYIITL